jgi:hypothetical protein
MGFLALAVASIGVLWFVGSGAIGRAKFDGSRTDLERVAIDVAATAPVPSRDCLTPPDASYGDLGSPDRICLHTYDNRVTGSQVRDVELWWVDRALVYTARDADFPRGGCVDRLSERWEARAEMSDAMRCPGGFSHVPHG